MKFLDIHSHILPDIDDGAKDAETAVKLLEMMKAQGITDVIATPHFDASFDDINDFKAAVTRAEEQLRFKIGDKALPKIHIGAEVFYFGGMGKVQGLYDLTLASSRYILMELPVGEPIDKSVISNITSIYDNLGIVPIIAHIERYAFQPGYKDLINLVTHGTVLSQINAQAVFSKEYGKVCKKLIKKGAVTFVATDSHSPERRPPAIDRALREIADTFGEEYSETFVKNTQVLLEEIEGRNAQ